MLGWSIGIGLLVLLVAQLWVPPVPLVHLPTFTPTPTLTATGPAGPPEGTPTPTASPTASPLPVRPTATVAPLNPEVVPLGSPPALPPVPTPPGYGVRVIPTSLVNTQPVVFSLSGPLVVPGMQVQLGPTRLRQVGLRAPHVATATLPPGVCPGVYPLTITDPAGRVRRVATIRVQGVQTATFGPASAGPGVVLNGRDQRVTLALPVVHLQDTTCGGDVWRLVVRVEGLQTAGPRQPRVRPEAISLVDRLLPRTSRPLPAADLGGQQTTFVIPHAAGVHAADLHLALVVTVPANSYAGARPLTMSAWLVGGVDHAP
jgi:hypothetical protein